MSRWASAHVHSVDMAGVFCPLTRSYPPESISWLSVWLSTARLDDIPDAHGFLMSDLLVSNGSPPNADIIHKHAWRAIEADRDRARMLPTERQPRELPPRRVA